MENSISTVLGRVRPDELGRILPHEHIASVYGRWGKQSKEPNPEWEKKVLDHYTPILNELSHKHECRTIVEVSPGWGFRQSRDLEVWAELSRRTGVNIVVATGYYTSSVRPENFADLSASEIADGMIRDIAEGIDGTAVRAGIIKIAMGDFGADDRKLCKAAAVAQKETGVSITTHTCSAAVRRGVLDLLEGAGVHPERIYLGHADDNATHVELLDLLRRGCNILCTIWGIQNPKLIGWQFPVLPKYHSAEMLATMIAEGYGDQVLSSIDYSAGFEEGKLVEDLYEIESRTCLYMFTHVLDMLRRLGVSEEAIERMLCDNPRRMLLAE